MEGWIKDMNKLTFLTEEQCFGDKKLEILKIRGTRAAMTDFSILLGGYIDRDLYYFHIDSDSSLEGRTGYYWTKSDDGSNDALVVRNDGLRNYNNVNMRTGGARIALPFSSFPNERSDWAKSY